MKLEHECWMVWYREYLLPDGKWIPYGAHMGATEEEALGMLNPKLWRALRTTISAEVEDE